MTIYISTAVLKIIGAYLVFFVAWCALARYTWVPWLVERGRKGSVVQTWPQYLALISAGPIGWVLVVLDYGDTVKTRRRWKKGEPERERRRKEELQWGG